MQVDPNEIKVNGSQFAYSNTTNISTLNGATKIFNKNDEEISCVKEGEIYLTAEVFRLAKNDLNQNILAHRCNTKRGKRRTLQKKKSAVFQQR